MMYGSEETLANFVLRASGSSSSSSSSTVYVAVGLTAPDYFNSLIFNTSIDVKRGVQQHSRASLLKNVYTTLAVRACTIRGFPSSFFSEPQAVLPFIRFPHCLRVVQLHRATSAT